MTLRTAAIIFGVFFIIVGICGFIPPLAPDHYLFGLFMVDTNHNIIHLLSGVLALVSAFRERFAKLFFQVFGIVYGLVALLGFFTSDLILIHVNTADNLLHLLIAAVSIYLGFFHGKVQRVATKP
jgi:hypothetical protein